MHVQHNTITGHSALKWLLVVVLVFAPLQGALTAYDHDCHADHEAAVDDRAGNSTLSVVDSDTTEKQCLCDDCSGQVACDSACNAAPNSVVLISFVPLRVSDLHPLLQAEAMERLVSHCVTPLLHPPKM